MSKDGKASRLKQVLSHLKKDVKEQKKGISEDIKLSKKVENPKQIKRK